MIKYIIDIIFLYVNTKKIKKMKKNAFIFRKNTLY